MGSPSYQELAALPLGRLMDMALEAKLRHRGTVFGLCTITNAKSGACSEDCSFCAQSVRSTAKAPVYGLKDLDTLLREAEAARKSGAARFSIVTSGRGPSASMVDTIAGYIHEIGRRVDISLCASLGIASRRDLEALRQAGLTRYHHNLEACRSFFPEVCTTHTYDERVRTIEDARKAGLEVCAGGIIGLGESEQERYSLARELADLGVESSPINILVPIKGTRLHGRQGLSYTEILRAVAMWRLLLPRAAIRIAGGREKVLGDLQVLAFMAGADAMLIGSYLTTRGRLPEADVAMAKGIQEIWKSVLGA